jgi:hypothetical protein
MKPFRKRDPSRPQARMLEPGQLAFHWSDARPPRLTVAGECSYLEVRAACAFPLSDPDRFISLLDGADAEIGVLSDLDGLASGDRDGVRRLVRERYFLPVLKRVVSVKERIGIRHWTVETDRGRTTFLLPRRGTKVTRLAGDRLLITDMSGNRFEIVDRQAMDAASRRYIAEYL